MIKWKKKGADAYADNFEQERIASYPEHGTAGRGAQDSDCKWDSVYGADDKPAGWNTKSEYVECRI